MKGISAMLPASPKNTPDLFPKHARRVSRPPAENSKNRRPIARIKTDIGRKKAPLMLHYIETSIIFAP